MSILPTDELVDVTFAITLKNVRLSQLELLEKTWKENFEAQHKMYQCRPTTVEPKPYYDGYELKIHSVEHAPSATIAKVKGKGKR